MGTSHSEITGDGAAPGGIGGGATFAGVNERHAASARVVADLVRTTLGPKGRDKLIVDAGGDVTVTDDGATVLDSVEFDDPIAELLAEVGKAQRRECRGGTATTLVLVSELLDAAVELGDEGLHPASVLQGYGDALERIRADLDDLSRPGSDGALSDVLRTRLGGSVADGDRDALVDLLETAVERVSAADPDAAVDDRVATVTRSEKWIGASELLPGVLVEKSPVEPTMPTDLADARVLLVNGPVEIDAGDDVTMDVHDATGYGAVVADEERRRREVVERVTDLDVDAVLCQQQLDDGVATMLAEAGVLATRFTVKPDIRLLSHALGVDPVPSVEAADASALGRADVTFDDEAKTFHVTPADGSYRVATLLLRGSTETVSDSLERAVRDALRGAELLRRDDRVLPVGGALEIELARRLHREAKATPGRRQVAIEAVADALEACARTLAENAGLDPLDAVVSLRAAHHDGDVGAGIDPETGEVVDAFERGAVDAARTAERALVSALELATFLVRIDDVLPGAGGDESDD